LAAFLLLVAVGPHAIRPAGADAVTGGSGSARNGWVSDQSSLSPGQVTPTTFGQLYSTAVDGQVYAQPVTDAGTVVVATENDTVAGIDESTGVVEWSRHLGTPWNTSDIGCSDISPVTGITGTPVIDTATSTVYLVTKSYVSGDSGPTQFEMHALSVTTGLERPDWPVVISGTAANDPSSVFSPETLIQRPALLLMNGVVYAAFGGFCDIYPYQGWIAGVSTANARMSTLWTTEAGAGVGQAGSIWQSGSGLASDGPGQLLFATGNGATPPSEPGQTRPPPNLLGQSIVRVGVQSDGSLATTDFFAPTDAADLNPNDLDLGSGGVSVLPDQMGTPSYPHLLVQGGKGGTLYLLNRDDLGGQGQSPDGTDASVDEFGNNGGIWSTPAAWPGDGGWLYDPTTGSPGNVEDGGGKLYAYQETVDAAGAPVFTTAGSTDDTFPYGSSSAVVTSDGTTSGTALVWIVYRNGSASELRAYHPVPVNGVLQEVWSAPVGTAAKFEPPTVDAGRVFLGTADGHVLAFGPLTQSEPLSAPDVSFGSVNDGSSAQATATLTASRPITVTSVNSSDSQFTSGLPASDLPANLATGDTLTVPVTFTPDQPGQTDASLIVNGSDGSVSVVSLTGDGVVPLGAPTPSASSLSFGVLDDGAASVTLPLSFANDSGSPVTVSGDPDSSTGLFTATGLPAPGTVLEPGDFVTAQVTFHPPATTGSYEDLLGMTTDQGTVSVPLTAATTSGSPQLAVSPESVAFGAVDESAPSQRSVVVSNPGPTNLSVQLSGLPSHGFWVDAAPQDGSITVFPRQQLTLELQFAPTEIGLSSASLDLTGNDSSGTQVVDITGLGVRAGTIPDPLDGGWTLNGHATQQGPELQLTDASGTFETGSAFWPISTNSRHLTVDFTSDIGGGSGADGLTLALADPSAGSTALGGTGSGLGFAGISGVAVALDTYPTDQIGVVQSQSDGSTEWLSEAPSPVPLRQGTHQIGVTLSEGQLSVSVDGTPVTSAAVSLTPQVLVGFTAGDGALNDRHAVENVEINTDTDPTGGATPVAPHFYNGNVEQIRGTGSDTTFFMMQRVSDLFTSAGLYGCTLASQGDTAYNTTDQTALAAGSSNQFFCKSGANVDTTDVNDNWDRTEVAQGVDDVGSTAGQQQLCNALNTPLPVDFSRSSKGLASNAGCTLTPTGYAKDGVPILEQYAMDPGDIGTGTSTTYPYNDINNGAVGLVTGGWLPGDNVNCTPTLSSSGQPQSAGANGFCSGAPALQINNNDGGGGAGSTAYRIWCATDTTRISDWGALTNLGPNLEVQVALTSGSQTATIDRQDSGVLTTSGSQLVVDPFAEPSDVGDSISGANIPAGATITAYHISSATTPTEFTISSVGGATGTQALPGETVTLSGMSFPSTVAATDPISGPDIPTGTTVSSVSGGTLQLSNPASNTANDVARITTTGTLAIGAGVPINVPLRVMGVNGSSGTEATFASYAKSGAASGCSTTNSNAGTDPNPATDSGDQATVHVALENNEDQLNQFAVGDFPSPDYVDQAIEASTSLYFESNGVNNTNPYAGGSTINGVTYAAIKMAENFLPSNNKAFPTSGDETANTYATARTLYNFYNPLTLRASTGGFLNWMCDANTNFNKGIDNSTGVNFDTELNSLIGTVFGFPRMTDTSAAPAISTPADNLAAPNNTCAASLTVNIAANSNQITLASGTFPPDIVNAGGLVGGGSVGISNADFAAGTTVVSGAGTNTLTLSRTSTNSTAATGIATVFSGVPSVTAVSSPQS